MCVKDRKHKNPDGKIVGATHLHIYKKGFNDRFAHNPEDFGFKDVEIMSGLIKQFAEFCGIKKKCFEIQEALDDPKFKTNV